MKEPPQNIFYGNFHVTALIKNCQCRKTTYSSVFFTVFYASVWGIFCVIIDSMFRDVDMTPLIAPTLQ
ncbi:MAG: hypothetical protein J6Z06_06995, partial [Lachnospiraceae bacterium]|nr:hypothetical protein [Lachnospiraceae bacterium]